MDSVLADSLASSCTVVYLVCLSQGRGEGYIYNCNSCHF